MDRRALFFIGAAVVCFVLVPLSDPGHQWVGWATGWVYVVLAIASALDRWSRGRGQEERPRRRDDTADETGVDDRR